MTEHVVLNQGQETAAGTFLEFLFSNDKTFVLSGGAGVGKTFLMGHFARVIQKQYEQGCKMLGIPQKYHSVYFTATTNKAAEILEKQIGSPVSTIHSFLKLKVNEDRYTGQTQLIKTSNWTSIRDSIVFIDESSMVDTALYTLILETLVNCKIVFVGDHAQLAPVKEELSPVYTDVQKDNYVFLDVPVRNASSQALMDLCAQFRETVETGIFSPIQEVSGTIEYLDDPEMVQRLKEHFSQPTTKARILCYTNEQVLAYNAYLRDMRHQADALSVGDILVVAQNHAVGTVVLNVEREVEILSISNTIEDGGFGNLFADRIPVQYQVASIRPLNSHINSASVKIATDPARLSLGLKLLAKQKNWSAYFTLKNLCADLRDKDACTVYKAQGSTYETVFIDLGNIGETFSPEQAARLLFVAVSRASKRIYLYGELPHQYSGG